ncbi:hypothetical protein A3Q34_16290 [Colwellia sp. PAMC 20917]|uniref:hypothetical protein n=1 Tax=Colwellia sp. PAMC 20917 TaxID=1816218 RepID=UPI000877FA69|nr:hypothetical protein [Colwellia sp. PAMC 20917]AOW78264.1 hypothetical protein A3Q34_16290 [Colwellia sp. PAMC 20917]
MNNSVIKITAFGLVVFFSSLVSAANDTELSQLKKYLLEKNYSQAYRYSESLADELAGELAFDFLAGLAAFGSENYQAAVFAFERVVILEPTSFNGRYYLALSYQKVDNLYGAIVELNTLLANETINTSLTNEQRNQIETQLSWVNKQLVARKRSWSHDIALSVGSDSNINSGSSQDEITLANGTLIPLFDSSKATSDATYALRYHVNYQYPLSQYQTLLVDLSVQNNSYFSYGEYNRQMLNLSVKYERQLMNESSWYLGASTVPLWFSSNKYRNQNAINFGWQQLVNNNNYGFNTSIAKVEHFVYQDLDFYHTQINAFYRIKAQYQHTFLINWYQDDNTKGLNHNSKTAVGASYIISYPIFNHLNGNSMIMFEQQNYEAPNPLFDVYSDATLAIISSELIYTGLEQQILQLQLSYQAKNLDSHLSAMKIYEYDRLKINLTWKYEF